MYPIKLRFIVLSALCMLVLPAYAQRASFFVGVGDFEVDAVTCTVAHAFRVKEPHIFISYKTWNAIVTLYNDAKRAFSLQDPFEQVIIQQGKIYIGPTQQEFRKHCQAHTMDAFKKMLKPLNAQSDELISTLLACDPNQWHMYDTNMGLYYFTPAASDTHNSPINTAHFTRVQNFFGTKKSDSSAWADACEKLFKKTSEPWYLSITGHGNSSSHTAGLTDAQFARILSACQSKINVASLNIYSCHISPERIRALAQKYLGISTFKFDLVVLTDTDKEVCVSCPNNFKTYWPAWVNEGMDFNTSFHECPLIITEYLDKSSAHAASPDYHKNILGNALARFTCKPNDPCAIYANSNTVIKASAPGIFSRVTSAFF